MKCIGKHDSTRNNPPLPPLAVSTNRDLACNPPPPPRLFPFRLCHVLVNGVTNLETILYTPPLYGRGFSLAVAASCTSLRRSSAGR